MRAPVCSVRGQCSSRYDHWRDQGLADFSVVNIPDGLGFWLSSALRATLFGERSELVRQVQVADRMAAD